MQIKSRRSVAKHFNILDLENFPKVIFCEAVILWKLNTRTVAFETFFYLSDFWKVFMLRRIKETTEIAMNIHNNTNIP